MRLISLFLKGREGFGLESEELTFGEEITELYGPNGCGKTPLIQSIAFCLGYPCKFRDEIYRSCKFARLKFEINGVHFVSEREFSNEFIIELNFQDNKIHFYNELEYSRFMFEKLGMSFPSLVTTQNKQSYPYLSTILPIFYLDQDNGYSKYYHSVSNYIKDQFSEMLRLVFSLPEKNSFDKKKLVIDLDAEIKYLDESLVSQRRHIDLSKGELSDKNSDVVIIDEQLVELEIELNNLKESSSIKNDALLGIDTLINSYKKKQRELTWEADDIKKRCDSLVKIKDEISIEINTLNLNEESKRIFLSFGEICPSSSCGIFSKSSDNYAKSLLYLKDQIKDIDRNFRQSSNNIQLIEVKILNMGRLIAEAQQLRENLVKDEGISSIVETISLITSRLFELQFEKNKIKKLEALEKKYVEILIKRDSALDRKDAISNIRTNLPNLIKIKGELREAFIRWLDILNTANVNNNISFKDDFNPILGDEVIEQLKGSTRVRAILAYRASLMEVISKYHHEAFKFIIFDTPKQHEIHPEDIDNFMVNLKLLAEKNKIQVIFSSTEYLFKVNDKDKLWTPQFPGEKHSMFMRKI